MGILAGLIAALAWTLASSLWRGLSTSLSAIQLNGLKNAIACAALLPVLVTLPWNGQIQALMLLLISGGLGISLGDSFYLAALRRLGTRRTLTLESLSPVAAATGGWFAMGEELSIRGWAGALLVTISVVLVARQQPPDATSVRDRRRSVQWQGLLMALLAVVCGVAGAAVSRTVLISSELTPLQSAACRLLGGLLLLLPWLRFGARFPTASTQCSLASGAGCNPAGHGSGDPAATGGAAEIASWHRHHGAEHGTGDGPARGPCGRRSSETVSAAGLGTGRDRCRAGSAQLSIARRNRHID